MKVLIIGNGFIARAIIAELESEGHELLVFSRTSKSNIDCKQIEGDIFDPDSFFQALKWQPQVIINTAWITTHGKYLEDASNFSYSHFTITLAEHVAKLSIEHLIVLGTCAEYGSQSVASSAGFTKLNPQSLYAKQKVLAFRSAAEIMANSESRFSWVRVFQPYGPGQDCNRLVPYLIQSIKSDQKINLIDTTSIRDWITTRDIASAISWIMRNPAPIELDIGTSFGYTNVQLLRHLGMLMGASDQLKRMADQVSTNIQVSVAGKNSPLFVNGWKASDTLDQGLEWVLGS